MRRILPHTFFRGNAPDIAPLLIGKFLVCKKRGIVSAFMISEVEAYDGLEDKASHASRGRTKRTEVMFGPPGYWYVYRIYGIYDMLNIVCGQSGYPSAILIRGVEGIDGPGKLTRDLRITGRLNTKPAVQKTGVWIEDRGVHIPRHHIRRAPRVGIPYAGVWALKPWRFILYVKHRKKERS